MTATGHLLLVGPEPLRRHLRPTGEPLVIDCLDGDPSAEVRGAGLFTQTIRVIRAESLDVERAQRLADAIAGSALSVLVEAEKLNVAVEKRLAATCEVQKLSLERDGRTTINRIAAKLGITLDPAVTALLAERLAHDPGRLVGTLEALDAGGFTRPSTAQIKLLAGSSRTEGLPWELLDDIEQGRVEPGAFERTEAIPTIAFLSKRVRLATHAVENPDMGREDAHESFGNVSESAWRQARRMGKRIGLEGCRELLEVLAQADVHAKRGRGAAALALAGGSIRAALLSENRSSTETTSQD